MRPGLTPTVALLLAGVGCKSVAGPRAVSASQDPPTVAAPAVNQGTPSTAPDSAAPAGAIAPAPEAIGAPAGSVYPIHGYMTSTYRGRWTDGDHDNDVYETLSLDLGDPARNPWTGHVMARVDADIDGKGGSSSVFHDLDDTFDGTIQPYLYDAWMERRDLGSLERVRLGRQTLWDTPVFAWFDGASGETKEFGTAHWKLGAYGGMPVHLYESSREGDFLAGAYAEARPWKGGQARLDGMYLEDETELGQHVNDLWHAGLTQALGTHLRLDGGWTRLEDTNRDVSASATWWDAATDFNVRASYFQLLTTQKSLASEVDPYFATLSELFPYQQIGLLASKGLSTKVRVQAGVDLRRVSDDGDIGQFNRDFERYFGTVTLLDTFSSGITSNLTGEIWNGGGSDIETWGLDLAKSFSKAFEASAGSVYALYTVEDLTGEERDHVRTYYVRLRWKRTAATTWDLRFDVEDMDPDPIETVRAGLTWRF